MRESGLSKRELAVLKIGGSVITDKNGELTARTMEIDRLAGEIQKANIHNLIIVHGGGSFGHPSAQRYSIREGFREDRQRIGFSETHHVMTVLNGLFMDSLIWHQVPAVSVTPSSCLVTENGRISRFEETALRELLRMAFIPVLYGDAILDTKLGFTILSGDQLVSALATRLNADRIIVGVDVDGLYDADPKVEKKAKMFEHLTLEDLKKLQSRLEKPTVCDVTDGIAGKVAELVPAIEKRVRVIIVNALKPGNIYKALEGETVEGTVIEKA
jgi:isopentenyl phosphate kinase